MSRLRIGVVGLRFGAYHVRTLATMDEVELVAVAERHPALPDSLANWAAKYGARAYADGLELLAHEELDAISIRTSPRGRAPLIEAAAKRA